jgi:Ca2+-binding RTX toxin-like protein
MTHAPAFLALVEGSLSLRAGGGNDTVTLAGTDSLLTVPVAVLGEAGHDVLLGGLADDSLDGGLARDTFAGNDGDDVIVGLALEIDEAFSLS